MLETNTQFLTNTMIITQKQKLISFWVLQVEMELIFIRIVLFRNMFNLYKVNLSRFDLCYFRKPKATDQKDDLKFFIEKHLRNQNV